MKILLVNTMERRGGAAIACGRLRDALQAEGVSVKMLVAEKSSTDTSVVAITGNLRSKLAVRARFLWEHFVIWACNGFSTKDLFSLSLGNAGKNITALPQVREADIIHLHWVNQGFISLKDIKKLTRMGKPVVWTMHDMWPFTGVCHYSGDCTRYEQACGDCPKLRFPSAHDMSAWAWRHKSEYSLHGNITFVGCSRWMADMAAESSLTENSKIVSIPNPIDTDVFQVKSKADCRKSFGLPENKRLLLFGADRIDDERKGFSYLREALMLLSESLPKSIEDIEIVVFGGQKSDALPLLPFPVHHIGRVDSVGKLVDIYNAVDVFIIPSLEDNLPNTIMESLSCGTPVVGFKTGGIPEMIDHQSNGYVARNRDTEDLMNGILWVLSADHSSLSHTAREKVMRSYSQAVVAKEYKELYAGLLEK